MLDHLDLSRKVVRRPSDRERQLLMLPKQLGKGFF
jgi:hypothetical protein